MPSRVMTSAPDDDGRTARHHAFQSVLRQATDPIEQVDGARDLVSGHALVAFVLAGETRLPHRAREQVGHMPAAVLIMPKVRERRLVHPQTPFPVAEHGMVQVAAGTLCQMVEDRLAARASVEPFQHGVLVGLHAFAVPPDERAVIVIGHDASPFRIGPDTSMPGPWIGRPRPRRRPRRPPAPMGPAPTWA